MNNPRLSIDLRKIHHNTQRLVSLLNGKGISVTGVTKSFLGDPQIAHKMLHAGVTSLGDSRIENIERMRRSGINAQLILIRSPMLSQVERVVESVDISFNTEIIVLRALSTAAIKVGKTHKVLLMVELGDLREGILPIDVERTIAEVKKLKNLKFVGLGANLACRSGVKPDNRNMSELSNLCLRLIPQNTHSKYMISGGNSSNLNWAFSGDTVGQVNNLRLGEAILLGVEPLHRNPIEGLFTDAIRLIAEVIESKSKPSKPWGEFAQSAFGTAAKTKDQGDINQVIVAIGRQDVDPCGLVPPSDIDIIGMSSDHLILNTRGKKPTVGTELVFQLNYSAVLRAMTSPHVSKEFFESGESNLYQNQTMPNAA